MYEFIVSFNNVKSEENARILHIIFSFLGNTYNDLYLIMKCRIIALNITRNGEYILGFCLAATDASTTVDGK